MSETEHSLPPDERSVEVIKMKTYRKSYYDQFMLLFITPLKKMTHSDLLKMRNRFRKRFSLCGYRLIFDAKSSPGNVLLYLSQTEGNFGPYFDNNHVAWVRSWLDGFISSINGKMEYS